MFNDILRKLETLVVENNDRHSVVYVYCRPEDVRKCFDHFVNVLTKDKFFSPKTIKVNYRGLEVRADGYSVEFIGMPYTNDEFMWTCAGADIHAAFIDNKCLVPARDLLGFIITYLATRLRSPSKETPCIIIGGLARFVGEKNDLLPNTTG